jgi:uncharacterized protein (TIGR02996 family)
VTTEEDFQRKLDENPEDWDTRLVFADWLEDRDDPRASGYRAIARLKRRPLKGRRRFEFKDKSQSEEAWWWHHGNSLCYNYVPADWFALLPPGLGNKVFWPLLSGPERVRNRRECEDALAQAFAQLPEDRQNQLLQPPEPPPE